MKFNRSTLFIIAAQCVFCADAFQLQPPSSRNVITHNNLKNAPATTSSSTSLHLSLDQFADIIPKEAVAALDQVTVASTLEVLQTTPILPLSLLFSAAYFLSYPPNDYIVGNEPYLRGQYDPTLARQFYKKKPLLVIRRGLQLFRLSNGFFTKLLFDKYILRDTEKNIDQRAQELLELIQKIGPTAIKVGQALSVRADLIPAAYAEALSALQDNVPPFPSDQAQEVLKAELGSNYRLLKNVDFSNPVASASIGQVYRGFAEVRNENGVETKEVAVKVQRPNGLAEIALDLFIVREFAPIWAKITRSSTDLQGLANEWGRGFIAELTYTEEAANTKRFNEEMKKKGLDAVTAPIVIDDLSSNRILTTEWVQGRRLDQSSEADVPQMCAVALNAYLVMLLETGTLHCDPHPGNLLRTEDGKLCILDFGMTLDVPSTLQYSLLEFIAHLTAENFEDVPQDLINLQFLKEEKASLILQTGALEPLYYFLKQANQGGGGTKVRERIYEEYREKYPGADDEELRTYMRAEMQEQSEKIAERASAVTGITMKVEDLQKKNSEAFQIPEWFLYTSRAFLTLEGISLQANPDFSIVSSCFPYVAKRLIGDDSPRSQTALRALIYGKEDDINIEKISELADGFTEYTTTTKIVSKGKDTADSMPGFSGLGVDAALTLAKDSADILLAPEGNLVQNLLIEESATVVNANAKDALREILLDNPERFRSSLPLGLGNLLPKGPVHEVEKFLSKSDREVQVQKLVNKIPLPDSPSPAEFVELVRSVGGSNADVDAASGMNAEEVAVLWKSLRENVPLYGPRMAQLGGKFTSTVLDKVSNNIEEVISNSDDSDSGLSERVVRRVSEGISDAAKLSSQAIKSSR